jgi:hypothetical protein
MYARRRTRRSGEGIAQIAPGQREARGGQIPARLRIAATTESSPGKYPPATKIRTRTPSDERQSDLQASARRKASSSHTYSHSGAASDTPDDATQQPQLPISAARKVS